MRNLFHLGAMLAGFMGSALAADEPSANLNKPRPSIMALRVKQPPVIDGVLDDPAW